MAEATGKPVSPGMEPATDAHWENVVHALKLSPDQMEEVVHLDEMREAWMARAAKVWRKAWTSLGPGRLVW